MFERKHEIKLSTFELVFSHIAHFFTGVAIGWGISYVIAKLFIL